MAKKVGLGRGLGALIKEEPDAVASTQPGGAGGTHTIAISAIVANPWQPRKEFEEEALNDLIASIKNNGVLQPLVVRKAEKGFELIAGERRLRASKEAGLSEVPVVIKDLDDQAALEIALVENIQREDLNVIEEAAGYKLLTSEFGLTQEQIAQRVGKARASVANALRLLDLTDLAKRALAERQISAGHAKVLLSLDSQNQQDDFCLKVIKDGLSVRALEKLITSSLQPAKKPRAKKPQMENTVLRDLEDRMQQQFGTRVQIAPCAKLSNGKVTKGSITLEYYSNEDLNRLLDLLGSTETL